MKDQPVVHPCPPHLPSNKRWWLIPVVLGVGALILLTVGSFFLDRLIASASKWIWLDENFNIKKSLRPMTSFVDLIINGPVGQGSAAPLDYIFCKVLDQYRLQVNWFNLSPRVYYRLVANMETTLSALLVCLFMTVDIIKKKSPWGVTVLQLGVLCMVPVAYLFSPFVLHYSVEIRPYTLWNSLWLLTLTFTFIDGRHRDRWVMGGAFLLALSATGAIFQLGLLMGVYGGMHYIEKGSLRRALLKAIKIFAVPLAISLYYCTRHAAWGYEFKAQWFTEFFGLWDQQFFTVPLLLLVIVFCWLKKECRVYSVAPIAVGLLYLIGPGIFFLLKSRSAIYDIRYFIYYSLTTAVFLLTLIKLLPVYWGHLNKRRVKAAVALGVMALALLASFRPRVAGAFGQALRQAKGFVEAPQDQKIYLKDISPKELLYWNSDVFVRF